MDFTELLPVFSKLTSAQQQTLRSNVALRRVAKGEVLHSGVGECTGLALVQAGQLRAYSLSDEGREVTLYRLFDRDICLFSASCAMQSIQFDLMIEAEKDTDIYVIPTAVYKKMVEESVALSNYVNQILATRFSEVMWLMEQVMWKSMDKRLAAFLVEEARLEGTVRLQITHEKIANHLGTAREVVTRLLKYFQAEGMVTLTRGAVELKAPEELEALAE